MYSLLTAMAGALISVMIGFNGALSGAIGNFNSTVVIHIVGLCSVVLVLILCRTRIRLKGDTSLFLYSAGAIGVLTVVFNNISFSRLGLSLTIALGLFGQSVSALVIDQFGLFGMDKVKFEPRKLGGFALITAGIVVMTMF